MPMMLPCEGMLQLLLWHLPQVDHVEAMTAKLPNQHMFQFNWCRFKDQLLFAAACLVAACLVASRSGRFILQLTCLAL